MISDKTKEWIFKKLKPYSKLKWFKISPNIITFTAIIFDLIALFFFFKNRLLAGFIFALLGFLFDFSDGLIARLTRRTTKFGYYLDIVSDFTIKPLWFIAVAYSGFMSFKLAAWAVFSNYIGILSAVTAKTKNMKIIEWLPVWGGWIFLLAILFRLHIFITIMIVYNLVFGLIYPISVLYLNRNK